MYKGCYRQRLAQLQALCITLSTRALLAGRRLDGARRQDGDGHARRLRLVASAGCARGPARAVRRGARHLGRLGRGTKARGGHGQAVGCRAAAATAAALGRSWLVATASAARSGVVRPVSWLSPTFAEGQGGNGTVAGVCERRTPRAPRYAVPRFSRVGCGRARAPACGTSGVERTGRRCAGAARMQKRPGALAEPAAIAGRGAGPLVSCGGGGADARGGEVGHGGGGAGARLVRWEASAPQVHRKCLCARTGGVGFSARSGACGARAVRGWRPLRGATPATLPTPCYPPLLTTYYY